MKTQFVGVRELKNNATQLVRQVREQMTEIIVTLDGVPVAVLRPFTNEDSVRQRSARMQSFAEKSAELAGEIAAVWTGDFTAAEAVAEQRR
jgi:prevent-host-death family protein